MKTCQEKSCQEKSKKVIAALELMAAVLAVCRLQSLVSGRRLFLFLDNEAARASLIVMYSPILVRARLLSKLSEVLTSRSMFTWVSRVPSSSNPADEPSRLHVKKLEEFTPDGQTLPEECKMRSELMHHV